MIDRTKPIPETLEEIKKMLSETTKEKWEVEEIGNADPCRPAIIYARPNLRIIVDGAESFNDPYSDATWIAASKQIVEYLLKLAEAYRKIAYEIHDEPHCNASREQCIDAEVQKRMSEDNP